MNNVPDSKRETADALDFPGADALVAAGRVTPPGADAVRAARLAVAQAALADRPDLRELATGPESEAAAPRWRRRRLLVTAAAVLALAVGGAAYPVLGGDPAADASAASFLSDVAEAAAHGPTSTAPYWKVRMEVVNQDDGRRKNTTYVDRAGRIWSVGPGGSVQRPGPKLMRWRVGERQLTWPQLGTLPADPDALAARLGPDAFDQAVVLLEGAPVRPAVRAALFEILAAQDGVELIGQVEDSQGRAGTAVEYTTAPSEFTGKRTTIRLVIAPKSGELLESASRTKGRPDERTTFLEVGPAQHVG
ncbi:hypothetical protein [Streptomyces endophyticus]|uniref:MucB/RseB N-terminal domain-containing protein n=1 Tax=Streptomyces endophyticus TaxID=714166 RepID=A0ABU6FDE2_9ACTN|nr:hypothetical protein [Streptomyces endophyticus]MEB8342054.1 hypothetical protein [Streptomyces endophyticus]